MTSLSTTDVPLAIVGMSCRLPCADGVDEFWRLLRSGQSAIRELPESRLNRALYYDPRKSAVGKTYTSIAGIVEPRPIDRTICRLSQEVIESSDESHVALCEVAAKALLSGGHDPYGNSLPNTGVYIGHSRGSGISGQLRYATMVESTAQWLHELQGFDANVPDPAGAVREIVERVRKANPRRTPTGEPNLAAHEAARMIARTFNFEGPYTSVNAACASSLMALGMAARALQLGRIDRAIVGSASHCKIDSLVLFSKAQSASASGSRPFDAEADGLVAAEGFVVFVIKTLDKALADRDQIFAVIRGIGISSDGHGKSLWAPRKEGQIEAIKRAYGAGHDMRGLGMIEAHATSTQLGDATELGALIEALRPEMPTGVRIPIGSVKGNIGHALESAGSAGLLKAVLSIQNHEIPPSIGVRTLNPKVDWENAPFYVPNQAVPFAEPNESGPRRAAINSFGIGGLNAHVVIDEHQPSTANSVAVPELPTKELCGIAIVGVAGILPGARTVEQLYDALRGDADYRSKVSPKRWNEKIGFQPTPQIYRSATRWGGFNDDYEYDWRRHKVPPKQIAAADPLQFMFLDAVDQAIKQADLSEGNWNRSRTGCVVGTRFTGEFPTQLQLGLRLPEFKQTLREVLSERQVPAHEIEKLGEEFGALLLDRMPALLDETGSFTTSTLASRITKTFDLMGGAAAVDSGNLSSEVALEICVEALASGQSDMMICAGGQRALGLPDYEELSLRGELSPEAEDGSLTRGSVVPGEGVVVVLLKRLDDAVRDGNKIISVIKSLEHCKRGLTNQVTAHASKPAHEQFGDLAGGSGMVALAKSAVTLECQPNARAVVTSRCAVDLDYRIELASAVENVPTKVQDSFFTWQEFYWSGDSLESLVAQVESSERRLDDCVDELRNTDRVLAGGWRLAIVAEDVEHLHEQCHHAVTHLARIATHAALREKGIFCYEAKKGRPLTAFCFPGQGSQSAGMLRNLIANNSVAADEMSRLDAIERRLGYPTFAEIAWDDTAQLGVDVWQTQLAMLLADRIVLACLEEMNVEPDRLVGHSYGEFVALHAAGAWSFETVAHATFARCEAIGVCPDNIGALMSTDAPQARLSEFVEAAGGEVHFSAINGPQQTVVGGNRTALEAFGSQLAASGFKSQILAVPRPFHTPLMKPAQARFATSLAALRMGPTLTPLLSTVNVRYVADPQDVRELLVDQLAMPVQFETVIERLYREGVRVFIEVGPRQTLSQLIRRIVDDHDVWVLPTNHSRRDDMQQLSFVRAATRVLGLQGKFEATPSIAVVEPSVVAEEGSPPPQEQVVENVCGLPLLHLSGSPYEMGFQHGTSRRAEILSVLRRCADQIDYPARPLPQLERALEFVATYFGDDEHEELVGMADAVGVPVESIIAHNLRVYPDMDGGCVHFAVCHEHPSGEQVLHGANEDLPLSLSLGECICRNLQLRRTPGAISYLTFATDGQLGGINGINARGIAVTSAMLLDSAVPRLSQGGLLQAILVRRILQTAETLPQAIEILKRLRPAGAWNVCISDLAAHRLAYVEYDELGLRIKQAERQVVASNHSVMRPEKSAVPQHSLDRLQRLNELLQSQGSNGPSELSGRARGALRDRFDVRHGMVKHATMSTVCRVDNQISVVMNPSMEELWITRGEGHGQDDFVKLDLKQIFGTDWKPTATKPTVTEKPAEPPVSRDLTDVEIDWNEFVRLAGGTVDEQPQVNPSDICQRFVMRLAKTPLPQSTPQFAPGGGIVVVGDRGVAKSLRESFPNVNVAEISSDLSIDEACEKLREAWRQMPHPHLFLATSWDRFALEKVEHSDWQRRRTAGVLLPFLVCQQWFKLVQEADLLDEATVAAATRLGGNFGFAGETPVAEGGALAGLSKGLYIEFTRAAKRNLRVKIVDFEEGSRSEKIVEVLCQEVAGDNPDYEIAYRGGERFVIRPVIERVGEPQGSIPAGNWLITGGARGVTAVVARELGRQSGVTLHLVGTSLLGNVDPHWCELNDDELKALKSRLMQENRVPGEPPIKAWQRVEKSIEAVRTLRDLNAAGIIAHYYPCDISDLTALRAVVDGIRREHGPIVGVVHGAGFESACRFDKKKPVDVERTLAVKVDGAVNLVEVTRDDPLQCFLAFGSISGRFGGTGQTDYCMANELLAKVVGRLRNDRPTCRSSVFHWHSWDEVGMAVRPESKHIKDLHGIRFMPTSEGARHFADEIRAGLPEKEVLITDWQYYKRFFPDPIVAPARNETVRKRDLQESEAVAPRHVLRIVPAPCRGNPGRFVPRGKYMIWGSGPRVAALRAELVSRGGEVEILSPGTERVACAGAAHLFLVFDQSPHDLDLNADIADKFLATPFQIVQEWLRQLPNEATNPAIAVISTLGGNLGLKSNRNAPWVAGLAGLLKSLHVERTTKSVQPITVKVLDFETITQAEDVVRLVLDELASGDTNYIEYAFPAGVRSRIAAVREDVTSGNGSIERGGTWVVTGGGRGITAELVMRLAREFDLRLHLLGRSPCPMESAPWRNLSDEQLQAYKREITRQAISAGRTPSSVWQPIQNDIEIHANLTAMQAAGIEAHYYSCDVADAEALAKTLDEVRRLSGPISGVIHGAGQRLPARFEQVPLEQLRAGIGTKVLGAAALMSLTVDDPLKYFVSFGSLGSRFGTNGGADYAAVNESLAKLTNWYRGERPGCRSVTLHWHAIGGAGMMTRPQSFGPAAIHKLSLMSIDEAYQHLRGELMAGCPECEILTTDGAYHTRFYPSDAVLSDKQSQTNQPQELLALLGASLESERGRIELDPVRDVFLNQHRFKGKPLLPMVTAVEAFVEYARLANQTRLPVEVSNLRVVQPLKFHSENPIVAHIFSKSQEGKQRLDLVADFHNRKGQIVQADRIHFSAEAVRPVAKPAAERFEIPESFNDGWYPDDELSIYHGPSFRAFKKARAGNREGWGIIAASKESVLCGPNRSKHWLTPSVVLDAALFNCGVYFYVNHRGTVAIPVGIEKLTISHIPSEGEQCFCHYKVKEIGLHTVMFDFVVVGEAGEVIVKAISYEAALFDEGRS